MRLCNSRRVSAAPSTTTATGPSKHKKGGPLEWFNPMHSEEASLREDWSGMDGLICVEEEVHKVSKLIETRVIIEPNDIPYYARFDEAKKTKFLDEWARELTEFFRDHRHQDVNAVYADPVYEDQCSACGDKWEPYKYEAHGDLPAFTGCGNCGKPIENTTKEAAA